MPKQEHDPISYKAARSQIAEWSKNRKVTPITRPVAYPQDWETGGNSERPREKGIDVALTVDVVTMAVRGQYDVGIVFSSDNDLLPAVEFVAGMAASATNAPRIEVAAWEGRPDSRRPNRLNPRGHRLWCHWLSAEDYYGIEDTNIYPLQAPPPIRNRPVPRPPQQWP